MVFYNFVNLWIAIDDVLTISLPSIRSFQNQFSKTPDVTITCLGEAIFEAGIVVHTGNGISIARTETGWIYKIVDRNNAVHMRVSLNYKHFQVYMGTALDRKKQEENLLFLVRTALECAAIAKGCLSIHASVVSVNGIAVAFSAPSGTGKSTRAQLWCEEFEGKMISGDRPSILQNEEGIFVCGVPWDGKEKIYKNCCVPLGVLAEIRRAETVSVRELTRKQARNFLMKQSFIPMWDTECAVGAVTLIEKLLCSMPVYRIFGNIEPETAAEIREILLGEKEDKIKESGNDMKAKDNFVMREIMDEYILMPTGENIREFRGSIVFSEVAAFVWEQLQRPVAKEELLNAILDKFEVEKEVAEEDLDKLLSKLDQIGVLE